MQILGMLVEEESAHRPSMEEEVLEESIDLHQEDSIYLQKDPTIPYQAYIPYQAPDHHVIPLQCPSHQCRPLQCPSHQCRPL